MPRDGDPYDSSDSGRSAGRFPPASPPSGLPPELDPRGRRAARPSAAAATPRRTRRRPRRDLVGGIAMGGRILAALLSLIVLVSAGVAWARYRQFEADIPRVQAINSTTQPKKDIDGKDQNILITGNDDRETATDAELKQLGTTRDGGTLNTDTMMILHVPADGKRASAVSFPRDTWVKIPGFGMDRLNAAYPDGTNANNGNRSSGAQLLVETLQNLTGLTIDHYVQVDLLGFYRISIAIGGVRVCLNQAVQEANSGINLQAGWQTIEGTQALAFVRQRYGLAGGDLDRIKRQQYFLSAVFRQITSAGTLLNPLKLNKLLGAVSSSLQMDGNSPGHSGLDPLKLAQQMQNLSAGNLTFATIPVTSDMIDGKSVQVVNDDDLPVFIAGVIGTTTTSVYDQAKTVAPSTVSVTVLNGSGGVGVAGANAATLTTVGFQTTIGNADTTATTTIRYPAGMESQAKTVAQYVPGAAVVRTTDVSVVTLIIGTDGRQAASSTSAPTPTPTAATPTTAGAAPTDATRTAAQADCIN